MGLRQELHGAGERLAPTERGPPRGWWICCSNRATSYLQRVGGRQQSGRRCFNTHLRIQVSAHDHWDVTYMRRCGTQHHPRARDSGFRQSGSPLPCHAIPRSFHSQANSQQRLSKLYGLAASGRGMLGLSVSSVSSTIDACCVDPMERPASLPMIRSTPTPTSTTVLGQNSLLVARRGLHLHSTWPGKSWGAPCSVDWRRSLNPGRGIGGFVTGAQRRELTRPFVGAVVVV